VCEREGERNFCNERLRRGKRKEERERDIYSEDDTEKERYIVRMIQRKRRKRAESDKEKERD